MAEKKKKKGGCLKICIIGFALFLLLGFGMSQYHEYKMKNDPEYAANYEAQQEAAAEERARVAKEEAKLQAEREQRAAEVRAHNERIAKINADREAKWGETPQASAWDGKVYVVERYLKSIAKDPKSVTFYGWSEILYNDDSGWIVQCDWGARNGFGGMSREVNWFVIRNGAVAQMLPGDSFRSQ